MIWGLIFYRYSICRTAQLFSEKIQIIFWADAMSALMRKIPPAHMPSESQLPLTPSPATTVESIAIIGHLLKCQATKLK